RDRGVLALALLAAPAGLFACNGEIGARRQGTGTAGSGTIGGNGANGGAGGATGASGGATPTPTTPDAFGTCPAGGGEPGVSPAPANATEAIRNVVVMLLMSPRFANHLELGGTPIAGRADYLALDPYEIASRLSYTFWQTLPDDALLTAAADGSLATDTGFNSQPDRAFADARTRDPIWQF